MRQVGLIFVGHADYIDANAKSIICEIRNKLAEYPEVYIGTGKVAVTDGEAVAEVRRCLHEKDCCGAILVLTTWVECNVAMSAIKELRGMPVMLWGFPLMEVAGRRESTGSYVSATMLSGVVKRLGIRCPVVFGGWNDPETEGAVRSFIRAAVTLDALYYCRIGLLGYTSMSIYTGTFDHMLLRYMIGPEVEQMDQYSLITAAEKVGEEERERCAELLCSRADVRQDVTTEKLQKTMALYAALRDLCREHAWDAVNVKCQYELSKEYKVVPCVALSMLADDGVVTSCEGDMMCTVSMFILNRLTESVAWYGDSLTQEGDVLQFSPCGFMPLSMAKGTPRVQKFLEHPGFSGIQVSGVLREEKITFLRLVEDIGRYHLLYGTGTGLRTEPRGGCMPALNVRLDGDIEKLRKNFAGQHYAICYGDLSAELSMLAELMGMEEVKI